MLSAALKAGKQSIVHNLLKLLPTDQLFVFIDIIQYNLIYNIYR